jgi:hypothetical protein
VSRFKVKRNQGDAAREISSKSTKEVSSGRKVTGFFGLFDILGYRSLIENNSLEELIKIHNSVVSGIDEAAVTINHTDEDQWLSFDTVGSFMFSDTIVLFQEYSTTNLPGGSFILKAALLMRLAFEKGIPLRGAISYGEYYIDENCYLGKPIVEAYETEKIQEWAGAVLCNSAEREYALDMDRRSNAKAINFHGIELNPAVMMSPFMENLIVQYDVPTKNGISSKQALCWDDYVPVFCNVDLPLLEPHIFENRVHESFSKHNKEINDDSVKRKMENTVDFLRFLETQPISTRIVYRG